MEPDPGEDGGGVFDDPDPAIPDEIDAREAARIRRRDHDAGAQDRDLMRPGMGKVFKQITDLWSQEPSRPPKHARKTTPRDS